jgi:hypothetical protein
MELAVVRFPTVIGKIISAGLLEDQLSSMNVVLILTCVLFLFIWEVTGRVRKRSSGLF